LKFNYLNTNNRGLIVDIFSKFLEDPEPEVRNACCLTLDKFFESLGKDELAERIAKQLKLIEKDNISYVRGNKLIS